MCAGAREVFLEVALPGEIAGARWKNCQFCGTSHTKSGSLGTGLSNSWWADRFGKLWAGGAEGAAQEVHGISAGRSIAFTPWCGWLTHGLTHGVLPQPTPTTPASTVACMTTYSTMTRLALSTSKTSAPCPSTIGPTRSLMTTVQRSRVASRPSLLPSKCSALRGRIRDAP